MNNIGSSNDDYTTSCKSNDLIFLVAAKAINSEETKNMAWLILLLVSAPLVFSDEHESRLYIKLLRNYNTLERPVENNSFPVKVGLQIVLNQIIDVVRIK